MGILLFDTISSECYELPHPSPGSLDQICACLMGTLILAEVMGGAENGKETLAWREEATSPQRPRA